MATEKQLIELIASDRIEIPISSISGKLKRAKPKLAKEINYSGKSFEGDRVYSRVETKNYMKARGLKDGISLFKDRHPKYGELLQEYIDEERRKSEKHLFFEMYESCRLTSDDYIGVITSLGFTENMAKKLYPELMEVSRNLSRKRQEERSILIG